jgi:hypothetical protein
MSSAFVAFGATFGTLYFRQETFIHANNLKRKKKNLRCSVRNLRTKTLFWRHEIAQMQAPCYLKEKVFTLAIGIPKEQSFARAGLERP